MLMFNIYTYIGGEDEYIIDSNANNEPIYEQIYRQIKSAIISSELKEGIYSCLFVILQKI